MYIITTPRRINQFAALEKIGFVTADDIAKQGDFLVNEH